MATELRPPAAIGFIGLGKMGRPMARRLAEAGYQIHVADKDGAAVRSFVSVHGGAGSSSLPHLAASVEAIITMLPDGKVVREVALGDSGLAASSKASTILIDMSSSDPVGTRELGGLLRKRGVHLIDAPVSGGVKRAENGSLSAMVGGDPAVIERVRPILETMAKHIFVTGALGSGHAMKALNNLVSAGGLWIAAEALLIGRRFGLDPEVMLNVLNASTGSNNSTQNKFKQQVLSRAFASGFSLGLMAKDLRTAQDLAVATGSSAPFTRQCVELWNEAAAKLGGAADHTAVVRVLEEQAGQELSFQKTEEE